MVWLGWGVDPQQPSIPIPAVCRRPAPTRARWRGQVALVCPCCRQTMSVCPWGDGCGALGPGFGAKQQSSPPKRCGRRRGGMRRRSQRRGGLGRGEPGFVTRPNPAAISSRQTLAGPVLPSRPGWILHSCLASHPRSPRLRHRLLPEPPNASSCCLRLLPFPSPLREGCPEPHRAGGELLPASPGPLPAPAPPQPPALLAPVPPQKAQGCWQSTPWACWSNMGVLETGLNLLMVG